MGLHSPLPDFREFCFPSTEPYLLDSFGGIYSNPGDPGNPLIECLLTPILPRPSDSQPLVGQDGHFARYQFFRNISKQVRVGVGVGNLPNLFAGRFVKGGQFLTEVPLEFRKPETMTFEIDTEDAQSIRDDFVVNLGLEDSNSPISLTMKARGVGSPIKVIQGKLLSSSNKGFQRDENTGRSEGLVVVLHEFELIRFYYASSSNMSRAVFSGAFSDDRLKKAIISDEAGAVGHDQVSDTHFFVHRIGFEDCDMPILGRILFEPDEWALSSARGIFSSSRASRINNSGDRSADYPRARFPFRQKTQLTLVGNRAKRKDGTYVFMVHRIERCTANFPFRNLRYTSIRTESTGPRQEHFDDANKLNRPGRRGPANTATEQQFAQNRSDVPPSADSIPVAREAGTRILAGLDKVTLTKTSRQSDLPKGRPWWSVLDPGLVDLSTGRPGYGKTTAVKFSLRERVEKGQLTADLETFIQTIEALQTLRPDWKTQFIPVGDLPWFDFETRAYRGYFPLVNCLVRQSMIFKFSFMNDLRTIRRQVIGVEVQLDGKFVYLFEAQRRVRQSGASTIGRNPYVETLPVLLLLRPNWEPVDGPEDFVQMLEDTVSKESKTWPTEIAGFSRDSIDHGKGVDSPEAFAKRVEAVISRNFT